MRALSAATVKSKVDFPTPGSPASKTTAPGTNPPPRVRSNSATPLDRDCAAAKSTSPIGRAVAVTAPAATTLSLRVPSSMLPHA